MDTQLGYSQLLSSKGSQNRSPSCTEESNSSASTHSAVCASLVCEVSDTAKTNATGATRFRHGARTTLGRAHDRLAQRGGRSFDDSWIGISRILHHLPGICTVYFMLFRRLDYLLMSGARLEQKVRTELLPSVASCSTEQVGRICPQKLSGKRGLDFQGFGQCHDEEGRRVRYGHAHRKKNITFAPPCHLPHQGFEDVDIRRKLARAYWKFAPSLGYGSRALQSQAAREKRIPSLARLRNRQTPVAVSTSHTKRHPRPEGLCVALAVAIMVMSQRPWQPYLLFSAKRVKHQVFRTFQTYPPHQIRRTLSRGGFQHLPRTSPGRRRRRTCHWWAKSTPGN